MADDLLADLLRSFAEHRAERQVRDNEPCPSCGGDRLRPDFTGSGRCHAARPTPTPEETR